MNKTEAKEILQSMTKGESLLRHARSVELVMEAYGKHLGEDPEEWAVTGMLHDADYEAWSAGLHREAYNTEFALEYGESRDDAARLESTGWRLGAARTFGPDTKVAIAYVRDEIESPTRTWDSQGVVVEITLSQKIVELTGN